MLVHSHREGASMRPIAPLTPAPIPTIKLGLVRLASDALRAAVGAGGASA